MHGSRLDRLRGVLANPWVDVALSGAATPAQVTSNAGAATPGSALAAIVAALPRIAESPDDYWAARAARAWS